MLSAAVAQRPVDQQAEHRLDELGRRLFGLGDEAAATVSRALSNLLDTDPGFAVEEEDPRGLMLDQVLLHRRGHPLMLAVVLAAAGRRAGLETGVFSTPRDWYAGYVYDDKVWLIDPAGTSAGRSTDQLRRHCGHEVAFATLIGLEHRLISSDAVEPAARAKTLRHVLRFDQREADRSQRQADPLDVLWTGRRHEEA